MKTADKILSMYGSGGVVNEARARVLTQYKYNDNFSSTTAKTKEVLESGIYKIKNTMQGIIFDKHDINTDDILKFADSRYNEVLKEIDNFWNIREKYDRLGFVHKRGVLLYGKPGAGKSCLLKQVMREVVEQGHVVFLASNPYDLKSGLTEFREVEPDRMALVIYEDIDESMYGTEKVMLDLLDGDDQVGGVLYLATTNYLHKMSERMLRPNRLDRKIEIKNPPRQGRLAYLMAKIGLDEDEDVIKDIVKKTDNFSFAQLRELLVSRYCLGKGLEGVISRIKNNVEEGRTVISESRLNTLLEKKFDTI